MLFPAPPAPTFPTERAATTPSQLRYEDCTQDGRLIPIAIPPSMGGLWAAVIARDPGTRGAIGTGVVPILTRLTVTSLEQPIRIDRATEVRGGFELAHELTDGEVSRLYMNVWTELHGMAGRIGPRQVDGAPALAGRLFAEHTFTRLFAPPAERRVTRFEVEGMAAVPDARHQAQPPRTAAELPAGGRWLDESALDPSEVVFTLDQTDANQHVNSLVYIRVFLDAAQRRLAAAGHPLVVRSRAVDLAYRKPCFAGDRVRAHVRLFAGDDAIGAAGMIVGADDKPRCYVRVLFG